MALASGARLSIALALAARNPVRFRSIVGQRADENAPLIKITEVLTDGFRAVHSTILSYRSDKTVSIKKLRFSH